MLLAHLWDGMVVMRTRASNDFGYDFRMSGCSFKARRTPLLLGRPATIRRGRAGMLGIARIVRRSGDGAGVARFDLHAFK
jgi:hypothetical protein